MTPGAAADAGRDGAQDVPETGDPDLPDTTPVDPLAVPQGCNPLAPAWDCLLPYPSDRFLEDAPETPTGRRVAYSPQAAPQTRAGVPVDLTVRHGADGFSWATPILAVFPDGIDPSSLTPVLGDYDRSRTPASPTVLIHATTGEAVAHIAELDPRAESEDRRALVIHPVVPLEEQTRYIVAIHGLQRPDGTLHPAPAGFAALRDGVAGMHPDLGPVQARFEAEVFGAIETFGVARDGLQLAWDFTTGSRSWATRDMLTMRTAALELMNAEAPTVTITDVDEPEGNDTVFRVLKGTIEVPLFLTDVSVEGVMTRDPQGLPQRNGSAQADFVMVIPHSVADAQAPARVLQFGHGFFGSRREGNSGFMHEFAQTTGMVVIAVDWWGMSEPDRFPVAERIAQRPNEATQFIDRVHQGMINQIAVPYAVRGLYGRPETQREGRDLYDPDDIYFYGISQGHILGGTYVALAPDIDRAVLGVGGAGLSRMMFRALPFAAFLYVVGVELPDPLDQQKWAAMSQTVFDRIDPVTYAPWVRSGGPAPTRERRVLMQIGIGDASVPNLAAHFHARSLGLALVGEPARAVWGLERRAAPDTGSGIVEFDFGVDPLPDLIADFPESSNPVHEEVRRSAAGIAQIGAFLRADGAITQTCLGPCDPD
jgi:hypothetical protein